MLLELVERCETRELQDFEASLVIPTISAESQNYFFAATTAFLA
jgi:hypothetical protein